jgi:hypothetical protein
LSQKHFDHNPVHSALGSSSSATTSFSYLYVGVGAKVLTPIPCDIYFRSWKKNGNKKRIKNLAPTATMTTRTTMRKERMAYIFEKGLNSLFSVMTMQLFLVLFVAICMEICWKTMEP